jgi:glycerophosphoryl diester phosphodiesterase
VIENLLLWLTISGTIFMANPLTSSTLRRIELQSHRGESHDAPENTMAAFNLAWSRNDDACELDIHLTSDGKLIVCHDADTERTSGKKIKLILKDQPLAELQKVDVGSWKDPKFAGEKMPELDEVLASIPPDKRLFIEIKCGPEAVPELVRAIGRAHKTAAQTVIISFNADALQSAKKSLPQLRAYYLSALKQDKQTKKWTPSVEELIDKAKSIGADGLDIQSKPPLDEQFVRKVKAAGLEMIAWTVDDPAEARRLIECGVDGITTNRGAWMRQQLWGDAPR